MNLSKAKTMIKYSFLQGLFWALYCACYGFITYFLLEQGFSVAGIGIITATFGLISAILQPILGYLTDNQKFTWKQLSILLMSLTTLFSFLILISTSILLKAIFYGSLLSFLGGTLPLINNASFMCQTEEQKINFGIARGIGSLCYGIASFILGKATASLSPNSVPVFIIFISLLTVLVIALLPRGQTPWNQRNNEKNKDSNKLSTQPSQPSNKQFFLFKYPQFTIMWIACIFLMVFHNLTNVYLINMFTAVGGTSEDLGTALSIGAIMELPVMFCFAIIYKYIKAKKLLLIAGLAFVVKATIYLTSKNISMLYAAQFLQLLSFSVYASATVFYAEESMQAQDKTKGQAFMSNTMTIGSLIASLLGGFLIQNFGLKTMLATGLGMAVAGTVMIFAICFSGTPKQKS